MKRPLNFPIMLFAALVMVVSFLGGALAPPLDSVFAARQEAPSITFPQLEAVQAMNELLLVEDDIPANIFMPMIQQ